MTGKQARTGTMTIRTTLCRLICTAAFVFSSPGALDSLPLFLAETSIGLNVASPETGDTTFDVFTGGALSLGARGIFAQDGFYSFASRIKGVIYDDLLFCDNEYVNLEMDFGRWSAEAGLLSALVDDGTGSTYVNPSWKLSAALPFISGNGEISFNYAGYLTYLPKETEDFLYQGIHAACRLDPTIFFGYELSVGGGWEYHYEQLVYEPTGDPSDTERHDLVIDASGAVDGFAGYFNEWAVSTAVSWRKSNAAFPVDQDFFLKHPEDRLQAAVDATIFTTPHQSLTVDGAIFADGTWYLSRPAREADGFYGEDNLLLLDIGASVRADWTPNQRIYIAFDTELGYSLSNDVFIGGWYANSTLTLTF